MMKLPEARGQISDAVINALRGRPGAALPNAFGSAGDPIADEDLQLTLLLCYELCYRGFDGVEAEWEWDLGLLRLRAAGEELFLQALSEAVTNLPTADPARVDRQLAELAGDGRSALAQFMQSEADLDQFREFVVHRSIYQLKEADPHSWLLPRLEGRAKAALVEIQCDEYGGGQFERMHSELFRDTMTWLRLDHTYGAYASWIPALTLASLNLMTMFGLHRKWRGALAGQLALFEMTSSLPNSQYGNGLRRLGGDHKVTRFFDVHVEADAAHEQIAAVDLCGGLSQTEPELAPDILFGAGCAQVVGRRSSESMLAAWRGARSSLLKALPA